MNLESQLKYLEATVQNLAKQIEDMKKPKKVEIPYYCELKEIGYHHDDDAGIDLPIWDERLTNGEFSTTGSITLQPGEQIMLKTSVFMAIPEGHYGLMDSRSGTSKKTLDLLCRTVDAPYRGNIRVAFINHKKEPVTISNKDELFQIVILEKVKGEMKRFDSEEAFLDYAGQTARGSDGFNSKERKQQGGKN